MLKKSLYVMLIAVSACWIILGATQRTTQADPPPMAQPYPTFSCSASAGKLSCSSSASPGIGNYQFGNPGDGWTGTGSANAGVGRWDTAGPSGKSIYAVIVSDYVEGGIGIQVPTSSGAGIGLNLNIGRNYNEVDSQDASVWRVGSPFQDKWASSSGCFAEIWDDAYDDYDGWL